MNTIGLNINNKILINRISGPVSMYYLKPPEKILSSFKSMFNIDLPIILLFGDAHQSTIRTCTNCNYDCCSIYDDIFLKSIDSIAQSYPVDFFTEFNPTIGHHDNNILFGLFLNKVRKCHYTHLRKENPKAYRLTCPTKNIRWHYSDSRFFLHTIEGYMIQPLKNFSKIIKTRKI